MKKTLLVSALTVLFSNLATATPESSLSDAAQASSSSVGQVEELQEFTPAEIQRTTDKEQLLATQAYSLALSEEHPEHVSDNPAGLKRPDLTPEREAEKITDGSKVQNIPSSSAQLSSKEVLLLLGPTFLQMALDDTANKHTKGAILDLVSRISNKQYNSQEADIAVCYLKTMEIIAADRHCAFLLDVFETEEVAKVLNTAGIDGLKLLDSPDLED